MRHSRDTIIKISLIYTILPLLLFFNGCSYSAKSDTNSSTTVSGDEDASSSDTLEIFAAYYWDRGDTDVSNDTIYISFNKPPSANSFISPHLIYNFTGSGIIGTGSTDSYGFRNDFSLHSVFLDASSQAVTLGETTISIKPSTLEDKSGNSPANDNPAKVVNLFNIFALIGTGDDTCVKYTDGNTITVARVDCNDSEAATTEAYWDYNQSEYIDQNFTANTISGGRIVKDNVSGLMWQDVNSSLYTFSNANSYCSNLSYAGYTDWRIPNMIELQSIVDRNIISPAVISEFTTSINTDNHYWASNEYINNISKQWGVEFDIGRTFYRAKTLQAYVKCVRRDR